MSPRSPTPRCDQAGVPVAALLTLGASPPAGSDAAGGERAKEIVSFCLNAWLRVASEPVPLDALDESFQRVKVRRMEMAAELSRLIRELEQPRSPSPPPLSPYP